MRALFSALEKQPAMEGNVKFLAEILCWISIEAAENGARPLDDVNQDSSTATNVAPLKSASSYHVQQV